MNFEPTAEQEALVARAEGILGESAGPARAAELLAGGQADESLAAELEAAGLSSVASAPGGGGLEAVLVAEAVARHAGLLSFGASAIVAPLGVGRDLPGPVAVALAGQDKPVRFVPHARSLIVVDGDEARVAAPVQSAGVAVDSRFGYPMGRIDLASGESLGPGSAARVENWWRVALAAEMVGTMQAALDYTIEHAKKRHQFGRPIGSFQAIQHRLGDCAVGVEGSRWLTYEAAAHGAPAEGAASAAAQATAVATQVFYQTHQIMGARGFAFEHDLHVWSMRLQALRLEMGGLGSHQIALTRARWMDKQSEAR